MILRIYTSTDAEQAKSYYVQKLSKEAYYAENQEFSGYWGGAAASHFGLSGRVDELAFNRFCDNLHPVTGEQLTQRMNDNRRVGEDFNFNCPKSVSLAYAYTKDERIIQALRQAVRDTMEEMEKLVSTRVRKGGVKDGTRVTGQWVYGEFVHLTARPVGGIPDPHLHIHCFVPNITLDPEEKKWKAMETRKIHDHANDFDSAVRRRLMSNLKELGLEIEMTKDAFEIAGISRELIEDFSRRTKQINAEAERRGITDARDKAGLAALTRENKAKTLLIPELEKLWWDGLPSDHRAALETVKTLLQRSRTEDLARQLVAGSVDVSAGVNRASGGTSKAFGTQPEGQAGNSQGKKRESVNKRTRPRERVVRDVEPNADDRSAVAAATLHLFERASVVTELKLAGEAARNWRYGNATWDGIKKVVRETNFVRKEIEGEMYLTTPEVMAEERRIKEASRKGIGTFEPMNRRWKIEDEKLNQQQRDAVLHVLNSTDLVVGIRGKAGTGKTTLLHEARRGIEAGFNQLMIFAPTSEAARDVLRGDGFQEAETVARLLSNATFQERAREAVWWIDEAGLLSNKQIDRLIALAQRLNSRLVLMGDPDQHLSVERGQAFKFLEKYGEMKVAVIDEIVRQRGAYKRFVEQIVRKDIDAAFETLDKMDSLDEVPRDQLEKVAAEKYFEAMMMGERVQATAPTRVMCDNVNNAIRELLKAEKKIGKGVEWAVLKNEHWTTAEKQDWHRYHPGQVVQINGHLKGFSLGEQVEVINARDGMVRVRSKAPYHDKIKALPLWAAEHFEVYQPDSIEISEGDLIRITCNGRNAEGHRFNNGSRYKVDYISHDGKIVFENGWKVDKSFKHLNYSYCRTSHGVQGLTVDRVIVVQPATSAAVDANQFYVSTTRGRRALDIITDSVELLRTNVSIERDRMMATELDAEQTKSSQLFGTQEENVGVEVDFVMARAREANVPQPSGTDVAAEKNELSDLLGRMEVERLAAEAAAQLERIEREKEERRLERKREMLMEMEM